MDLGAVISPTAGGIPMVFGATGGVPAVMPAYSSSVIFYWSASFTPASSDTFFWTGSTSRWGQGNYGGVFNASSVMINSTWGTSPDAFGFAGAGLLFNTTSMEMCNFTTYSAIAKALEFTASTPVNIGFSHYPGSYDYIGFQMDLPTNTWMCGVSSWAGLVNASTTFSVGHPGDPNSSLTREFTMHQIRPNVVQFYINKNLVATIDHPLPTSTADCILACQANVGGETIQVVADSLMVEARDRLP